MRLACNENFISENRFFDTVWYLSGMKMYDKAIDWMNTKAEELPGKKADVMRLAKANKPTFYRALGTDEKEGRPPSAETFMEWLEELGFSLVSPEEQYCKPTVCDMGDYAMVPKVRAKAGAARQERAYAPHTYPSNFPRPGSPGRDFFTHQVSNLRHSP